MHDSYIGFDQETPFEFEIFPDDKNRVIPEYAKEDLDAVKGPTMVQSMLDTGAQEESSSDNENENEFESLKEKLRKAGLSGALEKMEEKKAAAEKNKTAGKKVKDEN